MVIGVDYAAAAADMETVFKGFTLPRLAFGENLCNGI